MLNIKNAYMGNTTSLPKSTTIVIIGGGIVGMTAALTLAERNIPVVVLEKGRVGMEQSSRNLGWVRKTNRLPDDIPLATESDKLWAKMSERVGEDVGYRQNGCMFIAKTKAQMAIYEKWLESVAHLDLGSTLLSENEIKAKIPGNIGHWAGGLYTPTDGYAEEEIAPFAIARAAAKKGVVIVENCAARKLSLSSGKIAGVHTEQGEIKCEQVLLASGLWSRRFLGNEGIKFPTLPLICSVMRTTPMQGPTDIAMAAPNFSFRKHQDGGFVMMQRGAIEAPLSLDHLLLGLKYLKILKEQHSMTRITLNKYLWEDLLRGRHWGKNDMSPFEMMRTMNPQPNEKIIDEAIKNTSAAWPVFAQLEIEKTWGGMIDVTPDSNPVIDHIDKIPGLTIATGFSGHGFGTAPAAGQLAADLISGHSPIVDPKIYRFNRF